MIRAILLGTALTAGLSGCARLSESRLNPFNWFGRSTAEAPVQADGTPRQLVPDRGRVEIVETRPLVAEIASLTVERTPYGAIVRATGLPETQGFFNAELVLAGIEGGILTLDFRAESPAGFAATGTAQSRALTAAYVIDADTLAGIRQVRVRGANNSRVTSR